MGDPLVQYDSAYAAAILNIKEGRNKSKSRILIPNIKLIINIISNKAQIDIKIENLSPITPACSNDSGNPVLGSLSPDCKSYVQKTNPMLPYDM
ncbi:MAG: hypothetical protein M3M88_00660, partial [Thermoproteota archaeon]|nr:hypothetical protein [Thermoproteota archaeon]